MTRGLVLATVVLVGGACDCRPVPSSDWRDLGLRCNGESDFARARGTEQVMIESQVAWEDFLRHDCLRGEARIDVPVVDFDREVVIVDVAFSPLEDGRCVAQRRVTAVDACVDGVQLMYDEPADSGCGTHAVTGSAAIRREHVRAALTSEPDVVP